MTDILFRRSAGTRRGIRFAGFEEIRCVSAMACDSSNKLSVQLSVPAGIAVERVEFQARRVNVGKASKPNTLGFVAPNFFQCASQSARR